MYNIMEKEKPRKSNKSLSSDYDSGFKMGFILCLLVIMIAMAGIAIISFI